MGLSTMTTSWAMRWCVVKGSGLMSGPEGSLGGRLMSGIFWGNRRCGWRGLLIIAALELRRKLPRYHAWMLLLSLKHESMIAASM